MPTDQELEAAKLAFVEALHADPEEPWHQALANDLWREKGERFNIDGRIDLDAALRAALIAARPTEIERLRTIIAAHPAEVEQAREEEREACAYILGELQKLDKQIAENEARPYPFPIVLGKTP